MTILRMALGLAAASAAAVMYSNRRKRSGTVTMQSADGRQSYSADSAFDSMDDANQSGGSYTGMGSTPGSDWKAGLASTSSRSSGLKDDLLSPEPGSSISGTGIAGSRGGMGL